MLRSVLRRFRFSLRSVLVFILGIGVGHSLNSESLQRLIGRGVQPPPIPTHPWDQPDLLKIAVFDKNGRAITGSEENCSGFTPTANCVSGSSASYSSAANR